MQNNSIDTVKALFNGEVDSFTTDGGKAIDIFSIKHGTIAVCADGKWIYFDVNTSGAEPETDYSSMPKADYLVFTHDHYDHFDSLAVAQISKESTKVIANQAVVDALGYGEALKNGESTTVEDAWTVEAVPAYNTSEEKLQFHPQGRDNGYIVTVDGFRIYVGGDTEVIPELAEVKDIDVAFLPCNLPFTMTPQQCAEAALIVKPAVLFPYHYGDTQIAELSDLLSESGIDVRIRQYK